MLTRTHTHSRGRLGATLVAAAALAMTTLTTAPPALAEGDAECITGRCVVKGELPGGPGAPGAPGGGSEPEPGTIAPARPVVGSDPVYCQEGPGRGPLKCAQNVDPALDCIWRLMSPQLPPPAGADPTRGAWEECIPADELRLRESGLPGLTPNKSYPQRWWENPLGADGQASPEQAARQLVTQMNLKGIEIGMVPRSLESDSNAMGAVGLPAWMWVKDTHDPQAWGPYTLTRTIDGLEVTATARPQQVTWDMGDGARVACRNAGTPYQERYGRQESPTCGHVYEKTGKYDVTAMTLWQVEWSAGGESGVLETITRSTQPIAIGELQAVNVKPRG